MDDIYSIHETATINNITVKALRVYDEMGLLKPKYINPQNGYRYYTYDQFSYIDKIKRFKNIGMSLKELKEIFQTENLSLIENFLEKQKFAIEEETKKLDIKKKNVEWLSEFFEYSKSLSTGDSIYIKHIAERKIINVPSARDDSIYAMDMDLRNAIASPHLKYEQVLNPYGYILDYGTVLNNRFEPIGSTVSLNINSTASGKYVETIPEGDYICCLAKILKDNLDIRFLKTFLEDIELKPDKIYAFEYLSSLNDPANSPYELQIAVPASINRGVIDNKLQKL